MTPKEQPTERAAALATEVEALVGRLQSEGNTDLKSRELSCAITQIEQGLHWLQALAIRLGNEPKA